MLVTVGAWHWTTRA